MHRIVIISAITLLLGIAAVLATGNADAHCQIPCGIYDDAGRIATMREDAETIRKATIELVRLNDFKTADSFNQASRWVAEKDRSASHIQELVASYFLSQRVQAAPADSPEHGHYIDQLQTFHAVMVAAMRCKQAVDPTRADTLDAAITRVAAWYE
ncbi:MAG: superoxide dismutase [Ni] [Phycisphaerales bacterium]|jgi:nickel superoxide dismutase|nr:superoxide dismutase [Ni] [Phycisphaerales bacterium]MDP6312150.1 superoxide dismutase [Ni] [Phycisphaerales bacterium]MDP7087064.1 superoxide dismutase [Ni] [Phycisphaerales bacterium]MDP7189624.1 superoxide dismutase [Ni] [Phycisphaerales bacterium]MDP7519531.1 superoxide dismutase [Ni] [Phycisphaerales bacterium]|tara:strand:+ start:2478 stop:2945 length:468 start_codon:yes stop_codon:yes gene_type:complete